jgi:hypothetical protein
MGLSGNNRSIFSVPGTLAVGTGVPRYYFTNSATITNIAASVGTAPTGSSVIFDVNKNGTTIFTTQANRPTIAISGFYDGSSVPDITSIASGDYITIDIDQIGSSVAGTDAVIVVEWN